MNLNYTISDIAKLLNAKLIGTSIGTIKNVSIDSRSPLINEETLFFALKGKNQHGHKFAQSFIDAGGKMIVVEKELSHENCIQLVVLDSLKALQKLASYHRSNFELPVIGITGSNGKTTVKEWLYHVLKKDFRIIRSPKSYNSQIGVPLSVLEITDQHDLAIIEAGISMPNEMVELEKIIRPTIGVYTGIGDAHQENFSTIEEKISQKKMLFKDVENLFKAHKKAGMELDIPFKDEASILNSSIVSQLALYFKINTAHVNQMLKTLPFISMRMERMEGTNENVLINDTYSFDEKGLEIALQSIQLQGGNKKKVLIVAPEVTYQAGSFFQTIISANHIDEVIWISPNTLSVELESEVSHYQTVDEFIQEALVFKTSILLFTGARRMQLEKSIPFYQLKKHVTKLEIHLESVRKNLVFYKSKLQSNTKVLVMVKAQSYGSGSVEISRFLSGENIHALGVAYADEGVVLRDKGIELPILVMNPENEAFDDIIDYNLEPSIYSHKILNQFIHQLILKGKKRVPIQIKVDTGMHRLGFLEEEIPELISTLNTQPEVFVEGVFSHLAAADNLDESEFTMGQISKFKRVCHQIELGVGYAFDKHLSNTAGIVNYPEAHFDMVRMGIGLFGLGNPKLLELENALVFKSQVSQIKMVKKGNSIGYGRQYVAKENKLIGIIPVGYADGLSRQLSNGKWQMKVNNSFAPIIGAICMDMCMIDLTGISCEEGDVVEVFGWNQSIEDMASKINTIPYEIISSISSRVHRVYID